MTAGQVVRARSGQRRRSGVHEQAAADARRAFEAYLIAGRAQRSVIRALAPLTELGYHLLPDRALRRGDDAEVDLVVVGPSGLFILDTRSRGRADVGDDRMHRGGEDVTDRVKHLADLARGAECALAEIGLAPVEVHAVVVVRGSCGIAGDPVGSVAVVGELDAAEHISRPGARLTAGRVDAVLARTRQHFPEADPATGYETPPALDDPDDISFDQQVIGDSLLASALAAPVEGWMSFLAPEQVHLVRRSFSGPSRIRGAERTGKTVVGLHRAASLARSRPGSVLFTTCSETLSAVLATSFGALAPDVAERVEFVSVRRFAARVLRDRGIRCLVDPERADASFEAIWSGVGRHGPLGRIDPEPQYWLDEVHHVIKGRGVSSFEHYAQLVRTGRRRGLGSKQRRAVWDLYLAYEQQLRDQGICDFADQVLLATRSITRTPLDGYGRVIVDEAEQLSVAAMRMLMCVPREQRDGLTIIGEPWPGRPQLSKFMTRELGLSFAGRGSVTTGEFRDMPELIGIA